MYQKKLRHWQRTKVAPFWEIGNKAFPITCTGVQLVVVERGKEVEAKWLSITNHVVNVHEGHSSTFPQCAHGPLEEERQWLKKGTFI